MLSILGKHQMVIRTLVLMSLASVAFLAFAQVDLPPKMQGKWTSQKVAGGDATIELVKMEGAETARVKVRMTGVVNHYLVPCDSGTVETVAMKAGDSWQIAVPSVRCASYSISSRSPLVCLFRSVSSDPLA